MNNAAESKRCVLVHGGAGRSGDNEKKLPFLTQAADAAWNALERGAPGEEAVVAGLKVMEECEYFNAGYGGYPNANGIVLLDIGLMKGTREFVSLMNVRRLKYPSEAALDLLRKGVRSMMVWTHELMQAADAASQETKDRYGLVQNHADLLAPHVKELMEKKQAELERSDGHGTVGCILRDDAGRLFAGTSTGGVSFKSNGRIGDSPIIGSGVFADDEVCAISTSGHGEALLASCITSFVMGEIRRELAVSRAAFTEAGKLAELVTRELDEFRRKFPKRCAGLLLIPPEGPPYYGVRGGTFSVGERWGDMPRAESRFVKVT